MRPAGREEVPHAVPNDHRVPYGDTKPACGLDEKVRIGLGMGYQVARDHRDFFFYAKHRERNSSGFETPTGCDCPRHAERRQVGQELPRPRQGPDAVVEATISCGVRPLETVDSKQDRARIPFRAVEPARTDHRSSRPSDGCARLRGRCPPPQGPLARRARGSTRCRRASRRGRRGSRAAASFSPQRWLPSFPHRQASCFRLLFSLAASGRGAPGFLDRLSIR